MAVRRGGIKGRPVYQDNNAPRGYGQQRGKSPYLDREAQNVASALVGNASEGDPYEREPQRYEAPQAPVSHTMEDPERRESQYRSFDNEDSYAPQVQDRWGRSPGHPHYGQDPMRIGQDKTSGSIGGSSRNAGGLYGEKRLRNEDFKPGALDHIRGLISEDPENEDGTFSNYQLGRLSGSRQGSVGGALAPEEQEFSWEIASRGANDPYGSTADDREYEPEAPQSAASVYSGTGRTIDPYSGVPTDGRGYNTAPVSNINPGKMEGLVLERALSGGDPESLKDAFTRAVASVGWAPTPGMSEEEAEAGIREHIVPALEAQGVPVYDVQGEKIMFDPNGGWVDTIRGIGGSDPAFWWGAETGGSASGDFSGEAAGDAQGAFGQFQSMVSPNASKEEMESAIEAAFGHLPGYGGAYKESVMLNGQWIDLVGGYGGPGAAFQWMPKVEGGHGMQGSAYSSLPQGSSSPSTVQSALVGPTVNGNDSNLQRLLEQILLGNPEGQAMFNQYQQLV